MEVTFSYTETPLNFRENALPIWDESNRKILKKNYKEITIPWDKMHRMVQSSYRAISGAICKGGNMKEANFVSMQMILLDFDEGFRLDEMKERFSKYTYLIHTSRNHLKDKPNKGVAERFRVILPLEREQRDKEAMRLAMRYIVDEVYSDFGIDRACKDLTRIMFGGGMNCEVFYNDGEYYPIDAIIELATEWEQRKQEMYSFPTDYSSFEGSGTRADWYRENLNTPIMEEKLKFTSRAVARRNGALYSSGKFLSKDVGLMPEEVKSAIVYLNSYCTPPLSMREIEKTVFRSLRIA